ncbi:MAG TPA: cytochrome b/b6 domain-containing protein, partial [Burkholderiaceae bacterium]|nr:cytochrome b/b6 domain-containing protein [Burkholderiaceae bacterium]
MSALPSSTLAASAASPALRSAAASPWDLPLRLFHLGLLLSVGSALVTAWIGGNAMVWHGRAGAVVAGLLGFRLVWGLVGSPTSRFRQFLPSPRSLRDYLQGRWLGTGHNPLGALAVFAILAVLGGQVLTGLFSNDEITFTGPYAAVVSEDLSLKLTGWHQLLAWGVYGLLGLHLLAVAVHEGVKKHRLVRPMFGLGHQRPARLLARP